MSACLQFIIYCECSDITHIMCASVNTYLILKFWRSCLYLFRLMDVNVCVIYFSNIFVSSVSDKCIWNRYFVYRFKLHKHIFQLCQYHVLILFDCNLFYVKKICKELSSRSSFISRISSNLQNKKPSMTVCIFHWPPTITNNIVVFSNAFTRFHEEYTVNQKAIMINYLSSLRDCLICHLIMSRWSCSLCERTWHQH